MSARFPSHPLPIVLRTALVSGLLAGTLLAVPQGHAQRAAAAVTITYWQGITDPVGQPALVKAIALFNRTHPAIHVQEVDINGPSLDQKTLTAISGGKPPDAAMMFQTEDLGTWAARGALQELDSLIRTQHVDMSDFTAASLAKSVFKGHQYALPIELDDFAFVVNTDLFRAAGLKTYPKTLSEVTADAAKLTKMDASGRVTQMGLVPPAFSTWPTVFNIAPYFNGSWYDARTNKVTPDNTGVLAALRWEKDLVDKMGGAQAYANFTTGKVSNAYRDLFMDGHSAMTINGEWMCTGLPTLAKNVHYAVLPPPYPDGHPEWANSTFLGGGLNVIPTGSAHPKEALEFLRFLDTPEVQVPLMRAWGNIPVSKIAAKQMDSGCFKSFIDLVYGPHARALSWPMLPVSTEYRAAVNSAEDEVMRGKDTAEHAMAQVKNQMQAALAAAH